MADILPPTQAMELHLEDQAMLASIEDDVYRFVYLHQLLEQMDSSPESIAPHLHSLAMEQKNLIVLVKMDRVGEKLVVPCSDLGIAAHPYLHQHILSILAKIIKFSPLIDKAVIPPYLRRLVADGTAEMKLKALLLFLHYMDDKVMRGSFGAEGVAMVETFLKEGGVVSVRKMENIVLNLNKIIQSRDVEGEGLVELTRYFAKKIRVHEEYLETCLLFLDCVSEFEDFRVWMVLWAEEFINQTFSNLVDGKGWKILTHIRGNRSIISSFFNFIEI